MKETNIQTLFSKKIEKNKTSAYELKLVKTKSFPFSRVAEHQKKALLQTKHNGIGIKLPDMPHFKGSKTRFDLTKPYDYITIKSPSYIVLCWYIPRKRKTCYLIDIDVWLFTEEHLGRKSIREEEVKEIASKKIEL